MPRLSKIQVKSTAQLFPSGGYYLNAQRRVKCGTFPYLAGEVDFFRPCHPEDTWYIIPLSVIGSKYYLLFFPHIPGRERRFGLYREAPGACWKALPRNPKLPTRRSPALFWISAPVRISRSQWGASDFFCSPP
jgi:hypothetical protein